jgi:ABC-2 type transport system permease protein
MRPAYRSDFLVGLLTSLASTLFAFGFLFVLFSRVPRLQDWRFEEVLFIYGFSLIPFGLFNVISLDIYEFGSEYIIEGKFDRVLLRPVGSLFQVVFEAFRVEWLHEVALGLFMVGWAARRMGLEWSGADALLLPVFGLWGQSYTALSS